MTYYKVVIAILFYIYAVHFKKMKKNCIIDLKLKHKIQNNLIRRDLVLLDLMLSSVLEGVLGVKPPKLNKNVFNIALVHLFCIYY